MKEFFEKKGRCGEEDDSVGKGIYHLLCNLDDLNSVPRIHVSYIHFLKDKTFRLEGSSEEDSLIPRCYKGRRHITSQKKLKTQEAPETDKVH